MMIGLTNAQPVRFYISAEIMSSGAPIDFA